MDIFQPGEAKLSLPKSNTQSISNRKAFWLRLLVLSYFGVWSIMVIYGVFATDFEAGQSGRVNLYFFIMLIFFALLLFAFAGLLLKRNWGETLSFACIGFKFLMGLLTLFYFAFFGTFQKATVFMVFMYLILPAGILWLMRTPTGKACFSGLKT